MSGGLAFLGGELLAGRSDASGEVYRIDPVTGELLEVSFSLVPAA